MAKEPKNITAFGTSPDSFNESRRTRRDNLDSAHDSAHNDVHNSAHKDVHSPAHKDVHSSTHKDAHNSASKGNTSIKSEGFWEPQAKELKQKRVHFLTYESLIARMDAYAVHKGVKRVDVFEAAITAFLDQVAGTED